MHVQAILNLCGKRTIVINVERTVVLEQCLRHYMAVRNACFPQQSSISQATSPMTLFAHSYKREQLLKNKMSKTVPPSSLDSLVRDKRDDFNTVYCQVGFRCCNRKQTPLPELVSLSLPRIGSKSQHFLWYL